jgi:tripartite-type tricarboxylate transporter receptor subunit TctC
VKTVADLKTHELVVGSTGAGGESDLHPHMLMKLYGAKMRIVLGYESSNSLALAMERREIDGRCGWTPSVFEVNNADWIKAHKVNLLVQFGLEKHPRYPDVPLITDLVTDPDAKAALELTLAERQLLRPVLAPPDLPADRLAALRRAFDATMQDPAFLDDAKKQTLGVTPMTGETVQEIVERLHKTSPAVIKLALDLVN